MSSSPKLYSDRSGFTLIEVLISMIIMAGGLLALATGMSQGLMIMSSAHYHQIAKEKASEAMESVYTARDAHKISSWDNLKNKNSGGIFLDGPKPLYTAGDDGLFNTDDDTTQLEVDPGKDLKTGTSDDIPLSRFQREIQIRDLESSNLREIRIIVSYTIGHMSRQYLLTAYISPFS